MGVYTIKNIVLCSDGTGNSANKGRGTNVFKLYEAVDTEGSNQYAFYDDGVGTERWKPVKIVAGAFGLGMARNVRQLYASLCRVYKPGDSIYLFGFSRGAFTVRTLAGFILKIGVINNKNLTDEQLRKRIKDAYDLYRNFAGLPPEDQRNPKEQKKWERAEESVKSFRNDCCISNSETLQIRFIGVWDTVDAVGTPWDRLTKWLNKIFHFMFSDRTLSPRVYKGRHAVSIDDERRTFHPVMWNEPGAHEDQIKQVWFAGVHSNVGGGYPKQGISLVALDWMMAEAEAEDLKFVDSVREGFRQIQNVNDKHYNSRTGLATYYAYKPRDIEKISAKSEIEKPRIHSSVFDRIAARTEGYAPGGIPRKLEVEFTRNTPADPKLPWKNSFENAFAGAKGTLIARHFSLVKGRKLTQYLYMTMTIIALTVALVTPPPEWFGKNWIVGVAGFLLPSWAVDLVAHLLGNPYVLLFIAAGGLIAWITGRAFRIKQESQYSNFWNSIDWSSIQK